LKFALIFEACGMATYQELERNIEVHSTPL
jgi:hypothetical protein